MFWKRLCRSSLYFHIEVFIALTLKKIEYENGYPFFKIRYKIILRENIVGDFNTGLGVFTKLVVEDSFKNSKRKTDTNSIVYCIWKCIRMCCRRS